MSRITSSELIALKTQVEQKIESVDKLVQKLEKLDSEHSTLIATITNCLTDSTQKSTNIRKLEQSSVESHSQIEELTRKITDKNTDLVRLNAECQKMAEMTWSNRLGQPS